MVPVKRLALILVIAFRLTAALSVQSVWEVRTTGNDTNGGGFVTGQSGVDYSQNDNKNATACSNCGSSTVNLSKTDAVANGTTTITSATANFSAAIVGNIILLSGGSGSLTAGWYQVTTFTNSTTIVIDRTVAAGTGITINIGGALLTFSQMFTNMALGHQAFIKSGTYTFTTTVTVTLNSLGTGTTGAIANVQGYGTSRGDNGARPLVTTATNTTNLFTMNGAQGITFQHLSFSNTAGTRAAGFIASGASYHITFQDDVFDGFTSAILGNWNATETFHGLTVISCEVKNCTSVSGAIYNTAGGLFLYSYIHANVVGFQRAENGGFVQDQIFRYTVFASNTDTGITVTAGAVGTNGFHFDVDHCVFYNNTNSGILQGDTSVMTTMTNNIFESNGRYGWEVVVSSSNDSPYYIYNAANFYFNNTLGQRLNVGAGTGDVTGTADAFVNAGTANFALNSTAGGGTAAKAAGFPGITVFTGTGFPDIGALQSQAAAAATQKAYGTAQ